MKRGKETMWSIGRWMAAGLMACGGIFSGLANAEEKSAPYTISGYVDTSFTYSPADSLKLRVFDGKKDSFNLHNVELVLQKPVEGMWAGYKVVLNYGSDADVVSLVTGVDVTDLLDVQQAFVSIPVGGGTLMVGKMATLLGAEVIESPANMNFSRSFLFGYAIPFTHTGVRYNYVFSDMLSGNVGVNNGWDVVSDYNTDKTVEVQVGITPVPMLSLSLAGMMGGEDPAYAGTGTPATNVNAGRTILDAVATIKPMDGLTIAFNYDNGTQEEATGTGSDDAKWSGIAGYINYAFSEKWAGTLRVESFNDEDGYRTAFAGGQTLTEATLTAAYMPWSNTIIRAEVRHDSSDEDSFVDEDNLPDDKQDSVGVEFIYSF